MPYSPEYLELWTSLEFENADKRRLYSYQTFQGRDRKRQTDELFWRNSNELGIDLSGLGFVIDNTTGEITLVFDGTGDNPAEFYRWLTFTDGTNSIDAANGADVFTFEGLNDATVTVDPTNKKVSIDVSATGTLQNLIETINADGPDSFTASSPTDSIDILGSNGVVTKIVGDVLTITGPMSHRTFTGDSGTYSATSANSTFNILGGTGISTAVSGNTVTIENNAALQNAFTTINSDDVNTITALTPTSSFNVLGGTDITTSISGNSITIDYTGSGGTSLWTEDTGSGYLYPSTLAHKVGINTNTPAEQFTVLGNAQFEPVVTGGARQETLIKLKNITTTSGFTTITSNSFLTGERYNDSLVIEHEESELVMTQDGKMLLNNSMLTTPMNNAVLNINVDDVDGPSEGLRIESNQTTFSSPALIVRNTNPSHLFDFQIAPDGGMFNSGYASGATNDIETAAGGAVQALMCVDNAGRFLRAYMNWGSLSTTTDVWGEMTITHGLSSAPSVIVVTKEFNLGAPVHAQTVGEQIEVVRSTIGATTFDVRITDAAGSPLSNKLRKVFFIAIV